MPFSCSQLGNDAVTNSYATAAAAAADYVMTMMWRHSGAWLSHHRPSVSQSLSLAR